MTYGVQFTVHGSRLALMVGEKERTLAPPGFGSGFRALDNGGKRISRKLALTD